MPKNNKTTVKTPLLAKYPNVILTEREAECLKHILYGRSYKHIGRSLGISPRTVEFYITNMRTKFNCTSRYDLIEKVRATDFLTTIDPIEISNQLKTKTPSKL